MLSKFEACLLILVISVAISLKADAQDSYSNIGGIGADLKIEQGCKFPQIVNVDKGLSAELQNLAPGDFITKIDGQSAYNLTLNDLSNRIMGPVGTLVYITIWRSNVEYPISITRARLYPEWEPGAVDDYYHLKAGTEPRTWRLQPGWVFLNNRVGDFRAVWKAGILNPDYKVYSSTTPEEWVACRGYKFVRNYGLDVVWTPGLRYDDLKIVSAEKRDTFEPYVGYAFTGNGLQVTPSDDTNYGIQAIIEVSIATLLEYIFEDNPITPILLKKAAADGYKAVF